MIFFSELPQIVNGRLLSLHNDEVISSLLTDSRKLSSTQGAVFFAIAGPRNNGHEYIQIVNQQGIHNFIVEQEPPYLPKQANVIIVKSSIEALQAIVAYHRKLFQAPIIGITGSNGKTIVKEWLYQLLSAKNIVAKNPGSYNSQVGVPLSVWQLKPHHTLGIFEAGISKPMEMRKIADVIQPTIGVFTNIGSAHSEGFKTLDEKIEEKLHLFTNSDIVIYCSDHALIDKKIREQNLNNLSWGFSKKAHIQVQKNNDQYTIFYKKEHILLQLPFTNVASIENCFHCVAVMLYLEYSEKEIQDGISGLRSVPMRLTIKEGINRCLVIDDSYNNDLAGLQISLDFLEHQHQKNKKHVILSDVLQSGMESTQWIGHIINLLNKSNVHRFTGIGEEFFKHQYLFKNDNTFFFETPEKFLNTFCDEDYQDETILVKGARVFAFERIVEKLQKKAHGTIMEIDLGAMVHNFNFFRSKLKPSTKIMAMVKAFAYGSGSIEVANLLQFHKVDYLGVAYTDEGVELRKNNISLPIMVLNPTLESFSKLIQYSLEPEIYSFRILYHLIRFLNGQPCSIHIKIDTGMHRLGFTQQDIPVLSSILIQNKNIYVASVFSHLSGADEAQHDAYSTQQAEFFLRMADELSKALCYKPIYHLINSSGILRLSHYQFDMVRLGIGLYGIDPTEEGAAQLKTVATLKTTISQIHQLESGATVGYGRHGKIAETRTIATLAIGYADGYSRTFSRGVGEVLIKGKRAKVVGNVCMDMTMVDITDIEANEGDEVVVFGKEISIQELAQKLNTIPYEILTNTSERVKRIFVAESI